MIYVEYFSRRPGVRLDEFHSKVAQGLAWETEYSEDRLVLKAARTWRLGPLPEYFIVWYTPGAGFERFQAWEEAFRSGEADRFEHPFLSVARVEAAGCYDALREPVHVREGLYYAEYFRSRSDQASVARFFAKRAEGHPELQLVLLVDRIGRLGPDPGGLAVWALSDFAALSAVTRDLDGVDEPIAISAAGLYTDIGREIL
jgi:hypothetical protein